jgi:Helix-turn-helix domain
MQTSQIIIHNLNIEDLETIIANAIKRITNPLLQVETLNSEQVQKICNVSHTTLQTWRNNGTIPFKKVGNKVYYLKIDVQQILGAKSTQ